MALTPSYFFDLSLYAHAKLFDTTTYPWAALSNLDSYFKSLNLGCHEGIVSNQAYLINPSLISIGQGTVIEPGAYIQGPCVIGKNCVIRHGAYIRGNVLIGDRCVIGHTTELKSVIFLDDVHAAHFNYIGDSVIGNRVNFGAGSKCANLKLDQSLINLRFQSETVATGLKKLGAIIGDDSQIGCNSVTNPGTLIGKQVHCYPNISIQGFIASHTLVKSPYHPSAISY